MLDISTLMYPISFLRNDATRRLKKFRESRDLSPEDIDDLKAKHKKEQKLLEELKKGNIEKLEDYKDISRNIDSLKEKKGLSDGDWHIFIHHIDILSLPKSADELESDLVINANNILPLLDAFGGEDFIASAVESLVERRSDYTLYYIDDNITQYDLFGFGREIVYGIFVAEKAKKIIVAFRGSVTESDCLHDFRINAVDFELPGPTHPHKTSYGKVHKGFYEYLFQPRLQDNGK
eukprot:11901610-Ditylum_brightwellii.AAC.1